jgi:hypothetical protein
MCPGEEALRLQLRLQRQLGLEPVQKFVSVKTVEIANATTAVLESVMIVVLGSVTTAAIAPEAIGLENTTAGTAASQEETDSTSLIATYLEAVATTKPPKRRPETGVVVGTEIVEEMIAIGEGV